MRQLKETRSREIKEILLSKYTGAITELEYQNAYELVISVLLSAQCTDKRVNIITPALFRAYPDPNSLARADIDEVKELIKSCSFFNNKAKNLILLANRVVECYGGKIPLDAKELMTLAGVGQKSANVVLIEFTGANLMAVDTHVFRVSHRLGLCSDKSAIKTEESLTRLFKTDLHNLHQAMVLFGRYICKAKNPLCESECFLRSYCQTDKSFKAR